MEHIFSLFGGKTEHDEVPYVATEDYRDVSFLEYLDYSGKRHLWEQYDTAPADQLGCLIQTWLFFGLLQEVLGRFFSHDDYVAARLQPDGSEQLFVTTAKLSEVIEERDRYVSKYPMAQDEVNRLRQCITIFASRLRERAELRASILSVMCLQNALLSAKTGWHYERIGEKFNFARSYQLITDLDLEIMASQGWCRYLASRAWQSVKCIDTKMFLRTRHCQLPVSSPNARYHDACSRSRCMHVQIDPITYVVAHTTESCACPMFSVPSQSVAEALDQGALPLIEASRSAETDVWSFKVVPSGPDKPYVALSHVWADGLGNPRANELPRCKLEDLARKVGKLVDGFSSITAASKERLWFWLDSLLCPVGPPALKSRAMAEMRRTYREARIVLVLDSNLDQLDLKKARWPERAIHLLTSRWMRRLWTFQEGGLAKIVCFRVNTSFWTLSRVMRMCGEHIEKPGNAVYRSLAKDANLLVDPIRHLFQDPSHHLPLLNSRTSLWQIATSVELRDVSVPSDEGICLSAVIGSDSPGIEDVEGQNMAHFWKTCVAIGLMDAGSLFNVLPKLDVAGFRWAPRTLLYSNHGLATTKTLLYESNKDGVQLRLQDDRVLVDLPGLALTAIGNLDAFLGWQDSSLERSVWIRTAVRPFRWYQTRIHDAEKGPVGTFVTKSSDFYLIMRADDDRECIGKLVVAVRKEDAIHARPLATCEVGAWPPEWTGCVDKALNDTDTALLDLDEVYSRTERFFRAVGVDFEQERALIEQSCRDYAAAARQGRCFEAHEILPKSQTWTMD